MQNSESSPIFDRRGFYNLLEKNGRGKDEKSDNHFHSD
jgi:hypothetical protein